jgi:signal transduction histidine kinase
MMNSTNRLFCRLDGLTPEAREQKRMATLKNLGLLETEAIPVFDEAIQTAARFLEAPICVLSLVIGDRVWFKSAVGLSSLGLMNQLASTRLLPKQEAFCTYVADSQQNFALHDTLSEPFWANGLLVQQFGIRSYLGTPLITAEGQCIGSLAVMDLVPRQFSSRDVEFLALSARWCLREFEREALLKAQPSQAQVNEWLAQERQIQTPDGIDLSKKSVSPIAAPVLTSEHAIKLKLLSQLTEELRTPLTAVIGMASVLIGETFGALTSKQKEYLQIIHNSGQQMNSLVNDILKMGVVEENAAQLKLNPLNVEMLCQQVINSLTEAAKHKRQDLRLSVEPGKRIWSLDKDKVQQSLYFLVASVIEFSEPGSEVRLHFSRRNETLNIAVWASHPWLDDGLPQINLPALPSLASPAIADETLLALGQSTIDSCHPGNSNGNLAGETLYEEEGNRVLTTSSLEAAFNRANQKQQDLHGNDPQKLLGLILGCHLAESHGGKIVVQGSPELGYRYVLILPKITSQENDLENPKS